MSHATLAETIGLAAAILTTLSFIPQVIKIWKNRSANDISWLMAIAFSIGTFLWLVYGVMIGVLPIIIANIITCSLSITICVMKYRFTSPNKGESR